MADMGVAPSAASLRASAPGRPWLGRLISPLLRKAQLVLWLAAAAKHGDEQMFLQRDQIDAPVESVGERSQR